MEASTLKPVFVGTVAVDLRYGSDIAQIHPTEKLPNFTGELDGGYEVRTADVKTNKGVVKVKILFSNCIEAKWLNRNSNRVTAPDLIAGERVLVWRNADSEEYYWESLGLDDNLRQKEHVIIAISNTNESDKKNKYLDLTNCYIFEMDTINKKIGFYTNKNDGEPFAYDIKLDTKSGNYFIRDDIGNKILMDSANSHIQLINSSKSEYNLNKGDIYEYCPGNRKLVVGGDNVEEIKGKSSHKVDGGIEVKTPTYKMKSNSNTWDTPTSSYTGHVNAASIAVGGAFKALSLMTQPMQLSLAPAPQVAFMAARSVVGTITGDFKLIGSMNMTNDLVVGGNISASGTISAPSCNFASGTVPPCPASH